MSRVVIIDDDPGSRKTALDLLAPLGHDVVTYASGQQFLDEVGPPPALVLCDVMMPGLDGLEVTRRIRARPSFRAIPIVLVTALDALQDRVAGLEAGADDFLSKPVHGPELRARVTNLLHVGEYRALLEAERAAAKREAGEYQEQLLHAERLATLGTFAAGISHELKNIVSVFSSMLNTLDRAPNGYLLDDEAHEALVQSTKHAADLAQSVLRVSRASGPSETTVDVAAVVRDVTSMMRAAGRTKHVRVTTDVPTQAWAKASPLEAQQVLLNLLGNSVDALQGCRTQAIDIGVAVRANRVHLTVRDSGSGMSDETKARLFSPFFTTKPPGQGTGLGMKVIKQLVERWNGTISVDSQLNVGTTIEVALPVP